jgi:hypothetical protein
MPEDELPEDELPPRIPSDQPVRDNDKLAAALAGMKVPTIPSSALSAAVAAMKIPTIPDSPVMNALAGMNFRTPPALTAMLENAAKFSVAGATSTSLMASHQKMMDSLVRAPESSYRPAPIEARIFVNPLIGMAREQIELQVDANEALGKVINTLEVELAESRAETKSSRRYTRIALAIAAVTMIVSIVLGIAALIK